MRALIWAFALLGLLACDDAENKGPSATGDAGVDAGIDAAVEGCGAPEDEHTRLLTAPTEATIIRKTPTHPPVGADGLP